MSIHDPTRLTSSAFERIAERLREAKSEWTPPWLDKEDDESEDEDKDEAKKDDKSDKSASQVSSRRVASLQEIPTDFRHLGAGIYKHAHSLWELRTAEDDQGGYVLVRKSEERAVDMRDDAPRQAAIAAPTSSRTASSSSVFDIGQRVAAIRQGQVMSATVIMMMPEQESAMLDFGHGAIEERPVGEITPLETQASPVDMPIDAAAPAHGDEMVTLGGGPEVGGGPVPAPVSMPSMKDKSLAPAAPSKVFDEPVAGQNASATGMAAEHAVRLTLPTQGMAPQIEPSSKAARGLRADDSRDFVDHDYDSNPEMPGESTPLGEEISDKEFEELRRRRNTDDVTYVRPGNEFDPKFLEEDEEHKLNRAPAMPGEVLPPGELMSKDELKKLYGPGGVRDFYTNTNSKSPPLLPKRDIGFDPTLLRTRSHEPTVNERATQQRASLDGDDYDFSIVVFADINDL